MKASTVNSKLLLSQYIPKVPKNHASKWQFEHLNVTKKEDIKLMHAYVKS